MFEERKKLCTNYNGSVEYALFPAWLRIELRNEDAEQ